MLNLPQEKKRLNYMFKVNWKIKLLFQANRPTTYHLNSFSLEPHQKILSLQNLHCGSYLFWKGRNDYYYHR